MRSAARRRDEETPPEPPRDLAAEAAALIGQAGDLLLELRAGPVTDRLVSELVVNGIRMADLTAALEDSAAGQSAFEAAYAQGRADEAAAARQRVPRARHAGPARQQPLLRAVRGLVPAGGLVALRHSLAAHAPAAAKVALAHPLVTIATGTAAAGLITTAVVVPGAPGAGPSASSAQAGVPGWDATATPVALPSPPQAARTATAPRLSADGASRNPLTVPAPLPPASYVPPDAPPPDSQQPQDPQQQGQDPQQAPAAGTLSVSATALDVTGSGTGIITLSCAGGPCDWHVVAGGAVSAGVLQGTLQDGDSAAVSLTVDAAALLLAGSGTVTVWPGSLRVQVSWSAPAAPSADPSPAVSPDLPTAAASAP